MSQWFFKYRTNCLAFYCNENVSRVRSTSEEHSQIVFNGSYKERRDVETIFNWRWLAKLVSEICVCSRSVRREHSMLYYRETYKFGKNWTCYNCKYREYLKYIKKLCTSSASVFQVPVFPVLPVLFFEYLKKRFKVQLASKNILHGVGETSL